MKNYQNLKILQNLYRLKSLGIDYVNPIKNFPNLQKIATNDVDSLFKAITACSLCDFSKSKTQAMPGYGNKTADIMIIDYMVSPLEDSSNSYYCGRSGELLKKMIENVLHVSIEDVFFTHSIKCKPLQKVDDISLNLNKCRSYLISQIDLIKPKIIVTLGEESFYNLVGAKENFENIRGHIIEYKNSKIVPIYHPSFILRNPNFKKIVFNDLKTIYSLLENKI